MINLTLQIRTAKQTGGGAVNYQVVSTTGATLVLCGARNLGVGDYVTESELATLQADKTLLVTVMGGG